MVKAIEDISYWIPKCGTRLSKWSKVGKVGL